MDVPAPTIGFFLTDFLNTILSRNLFCDCLFLRHILTIGWLSFRSLICNNYNNTEKPHVGGGGGSNRLRLFCIPCTTMGYEITYKSGED